MSVQKIMQGLALTASWLSPANVTQRPEAQNYVLPLPLVQGPAVYHDHAASNGLGGVQIPGPNATSYEGWYFDAVSADLTKAITFGPFLFYGEANPLALKMSISHEDGTFDQFSIPGDKLHVSSLGAGSSAVASDGSYAWYGSPDLSHYRITLDLPEEGISGEIELRSTPCSDGAPGASFDLNWDVEWVNLIPDAQATVNLKVRGKPYVFSGPGYHDKNFGPYNFIFNLDQWYFGHGRVGDMSVVWFEHVDKQGKVAANAYLARDNRILHSACSGVSVRPFGEGVVFPVPLGSEAVVDGFAIDIDAGSAGTYRFNATVAKKIDGGPGLARWVGTLSGGLVGGDTASGPALWDMIGPIPSF
ncbi:hypothetical protein CTA2_6655 [Colletotrichum tanaceti]|uniref:Kievitone hydratase n=1 Tax=Colletotrichum tanaceti TaxID=1306861 RepID=A0A4U6X900_9PEZI|nr:hypothetical protein CTA2_6655 [Colletotrichum tanaceti]TKW51583.1 hypothetical protein CTA1_10120 [Colletotrichum tanaceti]